MSKYDKWRSNVEIVRNVRNIEGKRELRFGIGYKSLVDCAKAAH